MSGFARFNPQSDEAIIANINANRAAVASTGTPAGREMYGGEGALAKGFARMKDTLKSWGRNAQPELVGQDTSVFDINDPTAKLKAWDTAQRTGGGVGVYGTAPTQATAAPSQTPRPDTQRISTVARSLGSAAVIGTAEGDRPSMTSSQMLSATPLPKGFGRQTVERQAPSSTPDQDDASRLAARNAQYAVTAKDAEATAQREAFGANVLKQETAARNAANTKDRIAFLNSTIANNLGNQYNGREIVAAAQAELASILGQQQVGLKESEIAAGVEEENIKGGFETAKQLLVNKGSVDTAVATADKPESASLVAFREQQIAESKDKIKNSLSKGDTLAMNATARREAAAAKEESDMIAAAAKTDDPATALSDMREMKANPRGFIVKKNLKNYIDTNDKVGKFERKLSDADMVKSLRAAGYTNAEIIAGLATRQK